MLTLSSGRSRKSRLRPAASDPEVLRQKLTVLIPCKDERKNIRPCIESVRDIADEILVADSGSTDGTLDIVEGMGDCRIIQRDYVNSADFKNWAIPQAAHEWIFIVDADERVPEDLAREIVRILQSPPDNLDAYSCGFQDYFMGHELKYARWDTRSIRLIRRDACRYQQRRVHANITIDPDKVGRLKTKVLHYSIWKYDDFITKYTRYTHWASQDLWDKGRRASFNSLLMRPAFRFLHMYIIRRGFLDGLAGLQVCMLMTFLSTFLKQARLWEKEHGITQPDGEIKHESRAAEQGSPLRPFPPNPHFAADKTASCSGKTAGRSPFMTRRFGGHATTEPEVALLVTTYQKPWHLARVLQSIALQQGVSERMEVIVTDDGSRDNTHRIVEDFAATVPFPVTITSHQHAGFQAARCRNEGMAVSTAPYLIFLDGDCVLPPDHVAKHLAHRRPGSAMCGYCIRLDREMSARFDETAIASGEHVRLASAAQIKEIRRLDRKARFYQLTRHPDKPRLTSGNFGIWRKDFERINGFDENFEGWGGEDTDFGRRLRRAGIKLESILRWTYTYHLWHPSEASAPRKISDGANHAYLNRKQRLTKCMNGLATREPEEISFLPVGNSQQPQRAENLFNLCKFNLLVEDRGSNAHRPDAEILFLPGKGRFTGQADLKILVVLEDCPRAKRLARKADIIVAERSYPNTTDKTTFGLNDYHTALSSIVRQQHNNRKHLECA